MPWLSRSPSYQSPTAPHSPLASPWQQPAQSQQCPVTYVPPLIDGACGTMPLSQRPVLGLLQEELRVLWSMTPELFRALSSGILGRSGSRWTWIQTRDTAVNVLLTALELAMMAVVIPLWLLAPGIVFAAWACLCFSLVYGLTWVLNGDTVVSCDGSGSWTMENEMEEERWIFVSGIGTRSV